MHWTRKITKFRLTWSRQLISKHSLVGLFWNEPGYINALSVSFEYIRRHNEVMKLIDQKLCNRFSLTTTSRKRNLLQGVVSNPRATIKLDFPTETLAIVNHNKTYVVFHDKLSKKITIIEVGVTSRERLVGQEVEKKAKYELLGSDLGSRYLGWAMDIVSIVITWEGAMTCHVIRNLAKLNIDINNLFRIQVVVIRATAALVRGDTSLRAVTHAVRSK